MVVYYGGPHSLPSPTLFAINGNPVVLVFFFVRRRVIDINAIWLYGRPAERPVVGQSWWKDNDMQIDHVQTYVITIDTCIIQNSWLASDETAPYQKKINRENRVNIPS